MIHPASHCSLTVLSRGNGRSAVGAAAYISRSAMSDRRIGKSFNYSAATGLLAEGLVHWRGTTEELWNAAETAETRKNARVARELRPALPADLPVDEQRRLVHGFSCWLKDEFGVAVQYAIHAPTFRDKRVGRLYWDVKRRAGNNDKLGALFDPKITNLNFHAHILFTTRRVDPDTGAFGSKTRDLDDKKKGPEALLRIRKEWERRTNAALEKAGSKARIDLRSYEAMAAAGDAPEGLVAQRHLGPRATARIRRHEENVDVGEPPVALRDRDLAQAQNDELWRCWLAVRSLEREKARLKESEKIALRREETRKARAAREKQRIASARSDAERAEALDAATSIDAPRCSDPLAEAIQWAQQASVNETAPGVDHTSPDATTNEFDQEIDPETFVSPDTREAPKLTIRVRRPPGRGNWVRTR